jgi:hypothetical protein
LGKYTFPGIFLVVSEMKGTKKMKEEGKEKEKKWIIRFSPNPPSIPPSSQGNSRCFFK